MTMRDSALTPTGKLAEILSAYTCDRKHALAILQDAQREHLYIPKPYIRDIAAYLDMPAAELYAIATFYKALSLVPRGRYQIKVCDGTTCHIRGSQRLADTVGRLLGISPGQTTGDGMFSLEMVNCLGACALAPAMAVDETLYGKLTFEKVPEILEYYRGKDSWKGGCES